MPLKQLFQIGPQFHGHGRAKFAWHPAGLLLASAGNSGVCSIFDRKGKQVAEFVLAEKRQVADIQWDWEGETVAVMQTGCDSLTLWNSSSKASQQLETGLKGLSYMSWSKTGPQLVAGDSKGAIMMYNRVTRKKTSIMGKHSGAITCGAWSRNNILALGSTDRTVSLTAADGEILSDGIRLRGVPVDIDFARQKIDGKAADGRGDTTVSVNMGGKHLLLNDLAFPDKPVELAFQAGYGAIVKHQWFGEGYVVLGFADGHVVVISTHMQEVSRELFSGHFHSDILQDIAYSGPAARVASGGGNTVKLVDTTTWKEVRDDMTVLNAAHGDIESLAWTPDGQMLSVATGGGYLYTFLATMPSVYDHYESRVAFMSSLQEVSIVDTSRPADDPSASVRIAVGVEPAFLALGPNHVAVGMNDTVEFHALDLSGSASRTYVGAVDEVKLGPYHAAVRSNGQVHLHAIDSALVASRGLPGAEGVTVLPPPDAAAAGAGASGAVTCIAMTRTFLYWGTSQGSIGLFHMPDWRPLDGHPFVHPEAGRGVTAIFPNGPGTRALVLDTAGSTVLYNPVNGLVLKVPDVPPGTKKAIWDSSAWGVFALSDDKALRPYLHLPLTITGAALKPLGQAVLGEGGHLSVTSKDTPLPAGTVPTSMADGVCLCAPSSGSTSTVQRVTLTSHRALGTAGRVADGRLREMLAASLALYDMQAAWAHAYALQDTSLWVAVANRALEVLDIDTAMRVYRTKGDVGMVVALEDIAAEEDQALVAGHVAVLFGNFGLAQELYLSSGRPTAALYMHRDLQQYEQAMKLAESLAPDIIPELSVEYGKQLEFQGKYADALGMYQQANLGLPTEGSGDAADIASEAEALLGAGGGTATLEAKKPADTEVPDELPPAKSKVERLRRAVHDGTTRTLLRTGDLRRGMSMADEAKFAHKALYKDAGMILEGIKQVPEAAKMYTKAGLVDKAVAMLLTAKSFRAAAPLMPKVRAARLHAQYAKAMEASGDYKAAAASYEKARDLDSVVRLLVDQLGMQERAGAIVRQTRSPPAALHLSQYCQTVGDTRGAIEFLLIAQKPEEAFGLAMTHDEMELYVSVLTDFGLTVTTDDYARIAGYYEGKSDWAAAGRYYEKAEDLRKALMYYLKCGTAQVDAAIALVGSAKRSEHPLSDELTHRLLDDLTGERSSVVHDPRSIFKLYLALGKHRRAGETALVIARAEQTNGKYSKAHETLFESYGMLSENSVKVPAEMARSLELLHSYTLVKKLVALGDHTGAAHMLKRVVASISQFERHTVQVLTSAVIECQRAGMKRSSFQFASALMRPEHREHIKPEFRRKIEALVRRPKDEEAEVDLTPCPVCTTRIPAYALDCPTCRSHLPYCIVSGKHMVLEDWSSCPTCSWPALHSAFAAYLTKHDECPMCSTSVPATTVTLVEDPAAELKRCMALGEASESDSPEADADSGAAAEQASPQSPSPGGEAYDADGKTGEGEAEEGVAKRPKPQVSGAAAVLGAMGL